MVTTQVLGLQGKPEIDVELPKVFETPIRPDVIKKIVIAQQSHRLQPQGRDPMAGERTTADSMGTGFHLARVPRVRGSRYPKAQQAAFCPGTVGGRQAHPPKAEKKIYKRINKNERQLAIRSAIAATAEKSLVSSRGHIVNDVPSFPIVVSDDIQSFSKASEAKEFFEKIGVWPDVERVKRSQKIRAGRGKSRGRRMRHGVGPLLVINEDQGIRKAVDNFLGVDVVKAEKLNAELLAPGTVPGRLTIWTLSAFNSLNTIFT